tara:strand:+ start:301 stop:486 length:186 start_codon:yes stop_codon:yes gene_type:complete
MNKIYNMKTIKFLKEDRIVLNGVAYKPYKICELPPSFGESDPDKDSVTEWFNYKGYTYIIE